MDRSRRVSRLSSLLVSVAFTAACNASTASPTVPAGFQSAVPTSPTPPPIPTAAAPTATAPVEVSLSPLPAWPPAGGLVRVVNLYQPGDEPPFAIDVRQQGYGVARPPLVTVPPGAASPYFDPGDAGDGSTHLAFFRAGSDTPVDQVMAQGWSQMRGAQISIVVFTSGTSASSPTPSASSTGRAGAATYVVEEKGGDTPRPTPEAGKGLLWVDAQPLTELAPGKTWVAPAVGTGDGTCLQAVGDQAGSGFTYLFAQTPFSLPPGAVSLNVYTKVSNRNACDGTPALGPIRAEVAAGRETVAIIYGRDVGSLRTLVLPVGP